MSSSPAEMLREAPMRSCFPSKVQKVLGAQEWLISATKGSKEAPRLWAGWELLIVWFFAGRIMEVVSARLLVRIWFFLLIYS